MREMNKPSDAPTCPTCGYDLRGLDLPRACPERGKRVTSAHVEEFRRQVEYGRGLWRWGMVTLGVVLAYGPVAAFVMRVPPVRPLLIVFAVHVAVVGLTAGLGCVPAIFLNPPARRAACTWWMRSLWILHLGWLSAVMAGRLAQLPTDEGGGMETATFALICPAVAFMAWGFRTDAEREKAGLTSARWMYQWDLFLAIALTPLLMLWAFIHIAAGKYA